MEQEDLNDEQIHQLLMDAAKRMSSTPPLAIPSKSKQSVVSSNITDIPRSVNDESSTYLSPSGISTHLKASRLVDDQQRKLASRGRVVPSVATAKTKADTGRNINAGSDWYNLPRTDLTPELKRDLQLIRMRSVLDPKRHYKKDNSRGAPEYSQVGTIIEGPTDFFSSRIPTKERKQTFVEEILAGEAVNKRFKSKYADIQISKTSGKKAYYKALIAKRRSKGKL